MSLSEKYNLGSTGKIVEAFLVSKLPIIFIIGSLLAGAAALILTPREEEPQIVVPVVDIMINFPGASPEEVENLVTINLERKLWEIDGVEYIYSSSRPGAAVVTARFYVGQNFETSILKVNSKIMSYVDSVPPGVTGWVVRPVDVNDVPIVTFSLYSPVYSDYELRRVADEILHRLQSIQDTGKAYVVGGRKRQIKVLLQPESLAARHISVLEMERALKGANVNLRAGSMDEMNREILVDAGPFIGSVEEVKDLVLGVYDGKPVYIRDVAQVEDGPQEAETYTRLTFGPGATLDPDTRGSKTALQGKAYNQVTIAIAKRKGTNAVQVAEGLIKKVEDLKREVIPSNVEVLVTRNYGRTADEKVNELMSHLGIAVISIVALLTIVLGWREAIIVALAVPMTLAVTLLTNFLVGYTINRVTLFALILSLGLLVDDPIVDVENIHRHFKLKDHPPLDATLLAVDEVRPPTIMATLAVIASFIPLFFITGMMGPYMRPMALNVPIAMLMSLVIAFTVTPWITYHALKREYGEQEKPYDFKTGAVYRIYKRVITPFLESRRKTYMFLGGVFLALLGSLTLVAFKLVPLKMLPFDNKNEFLVLVDMPRGTTLETTDKVVSDLEHYLSTLNEVRDLESYVGIASPVDFNGLVRQYYFRKGSYVADIRVNLLEKYERAFQSHAMALRIRPDIRQLSERVGANVKIVEVPPGPPVLSTIVAEVYGPPGATYRNIIDEAKKVRKMMESTVDVVDVDDTVEAPQTRYHFVVDRTKAGLNGITQDDVVRSAEIFLGGESPTAMHSDAEREPLEINLRLPRDLRSRPEDMGPLRIKAADGSMVPFNELGNLQKGIIQQAIFRKNLERVVYVTGETAGRSPVDAILDLTAAAEKTPLHEGFKVKWSGEGEWKITLEVFRDLGLAFAGALILIYILLVQQTESFAIPLVIMVAIPLTMIGILPGFALLNALFAQSIGKYSDSIFFTATGMIGMIALAGIVVRNSIILIDFIHVRMRAGEELEQAIVESGAVRLTPICLTAGAAIFGSWIITLDPVFSGLAWSFIFGVFASTAFTLLVVPMIYHLIYGKRTTVTSSAKNT
ncbi:MAG TPA: efflux RND transporter permease subunit [Desulfomonilaceae bacterium]|nr:efflux RND transporter permease subunit [Desulfomonilaceae bacterium]